MGSSSLPGAAPIMSCPLPVSLSSGQSEPPPTSLQGTMQAAG